MGFLPRACLLASFPRDSSQNWTPTRRQTLAVIVTSAATPHPPKISSTGGKRKIEFVRFVFRGREGGRAGGGARILLPSVNRRSTKDEGSDFANVENSSISVSVGSS